MARSRSPVVIILLLVAVSCASVTARHDNSADDLGPIAEILIGESKASVIKKLGLPTSKSSEKFPSAEYEVLEYSKSDGVPSGYISVDPDSGKVAGRSIWISEGQPGQEFGDLRLRLFPKSKFETFITCDKHHADEMKFDQRLGVFVGLSKGHVILVSWSDPRLSKLRAEQFFLKCPERQSR